MNMTVLSFDLLVQRIFFKASIAVPHYLRFIESKINISVPNSFSLAEFCILTMRQVFQ